MERAAEAAGSWFKLARKLGVTHQAVYDWRKRGYVPPKRALEIEVHFGIPAKDLIDPALLEIATLIVP
jgi:hypothetical protein